MRTKVLGLKDMSWCKGNTNAVTRVTANPGDCRAQCTVAGGGSEGQQAVLLRVRPLSQQDSGGSAQERARRPEALGGSCDIEVCAQPFYRRRSR